MPSHSLAYLGKAFLAMALIGLGWQALMLISERSYVAEVMSCQIKTDTFGVFPYGAEHIRRLHCALVYKVGNEIKIASAQTQISDHRSSQAELISGKKVLIRVSELQPEKAEFQSAPRETWGRVFFFVLTGLIAWLCLNQSRIK